MGAKVTGSQRVGVNVQPDQEVVIGGLVEHALVVRAIARHTYLAGARRVSVDDQDLQVQHAAAELGPAEWLGRTPEHVLAGIRGWGTGQAGADPADRQPSARAVRRSGPGAGGRLGGGRSPSKGWARAIFGAPELER